MLRDKEGVLHVACGMVGSEVHLGEHVEVVFHFWTVSQYESHAREDVDDFVGDNGQRMACAELDRVGGTCEVNQFVARFLCLALFAQLVDALCSERLELVDFHAHLFFLVCRHVTEIIHQGSNFALFAKVLQSELFDFFSILGAQRLYFLKEFVYLVE